MTTRLENLQVIYGLAGAREQFERLCALLIKSEYSDARAICVCRGDGGVDQSVGDWNGISPVTVFQEKYFPNRLGDAQKGEIRESYERASENTNFTLANWILCLPIDLSTEEQRWWDGWKAKQDPTGQVIQLWPALKIEHLLALEKNRGIKEEFFKEEHLTQIRDIHRVVMSAREPLGAKGAGMDAQHFERQRTEWTSPLLESVRSRGHWEFTIRPSTFIERRIPDIRSMHDILADAATRISSAWSIPTAEELVIGDDWAAQETDMLFGPRVLRCFLSGQFIYTLSFEEDWLDRLTMSQVTETEWAAKADRYLAIDWSVTLLAAVFLLASKLAQTAPYRTEHMQVEIKATGLQGRTLYDPDRHTAYDKARTPTFTHRKEYAAGDLIATHRQKALEAAAELFMRFGIRPTAGELEGYINIQG